jgi:hypothetical protein
MNAKTINGTKVEILSLSGGNLVICSVANRSHNAQVDASDLVLDPDCEIPDEFTGLHFYDPNAESAAQSAQATTKEPVVAANLIIEA